MMTRWRRITGGLIVALWLVVASGCESGAWGRKKTPAEPKPESAVPADSILADTVGAYAMMGAAYPLHLRGYGIVVGLGKNGGSDCPTIIRDYLIDVLAREASARNPRRNRSAFSPQRLIDSLDTAVVVVHGIVPPAAPRHTVFDLQVQAVGTQTRSLKGGLLLPCELRRFEATAVGKELVTGPALAYAGGLIYMPRPDGGGSGTTSNLRRGLVLGGGRTTENRPVRLLMREPSYWMARKIEQRLNERFGRHPAVAEAVSKGYLTLTTPPAYADQPAHFIELATHVYLENSPELADRKLRQLAEHLDEDDTVRNHISLIWEGMGRAVTERIRPLYEHADRGVAFYAARAGLRLGDVNALATLAQAARAADDPHRLDAIVELGHSDYPQAARALAGLLNDRDDVVRIAAYEALREHRYPAIETTAFASTLDPRQTSVILDVVESSGRPLIYAHTSRSPRIAVFGRRTPLVLPLFYNHPDDRVTLNGPKVGGKVSILWQTRSGRIVSKPVVVEPRVVQLIRGLADLPVTDDAGALRGVGLDYDVLLEVLDGLCGSGVIPGRFVLQKTLVENLLAPPERPERPEAAEPPAVDQPAPVRPDAAPGEGEPLPGRRRQNGRTE